MKIMNTLTSLTEKQSGLTQEMKLILTSVWNTFRKKIYWKPKKKRTLGVETKNIQNFYLSQHHRAECKIEYLEIVDKFDFLTYQTTHTDEAGKMDQNKEWS